MVNLTINKIDISVPEGITILEAAKMNNIKIPTFCYLDSIQKMGSCRICVVEVEGQRNLVASCMAEVREGMKIDTNSLRVRNARKNIYKLILSDHPKDCLKCVRNQRCELQQLEEMIQLDYHEFVGEISKNISDRSNPSIIRDNAKCVLCRRCVTVCNGYGIGYYKYSKPRFKSVVGTTADLPLGEISCTYCGQCTVVCPVGALNEKDAIRDVWKALSDKSKRVVIQTAPAVRVALGEEFGYPPGTIVTGKMVTAMKRLGFHDIFDTNFAADLTIIEEGNEFLQRVKGLLEGDKSTLPMITSCSPGWIKYAEHYFPNELQHLSTCKSPHMMLGSLAKTFYAEKVGVKPEDIYVVSVMPCTAKKFEITRDEMFIEGSPNVDAVLTTREFARMIKEAGIDFVNLPEEKFDNPLGLSSGAADIFGVTGGVMEAAIRTVYEVITGRELPFEGLHIAPIEGFDRIKTADLKFENVLPEWNKLEGVTVKVAVTSGFVGAKELMKQVRDGNSPYHFIEIMGCPGGCISGGGQPRPTNDFVRQKRMEAIFREDEGKELRKSHENPFVTKLYEEYLGYPNGEISHRILHTHYVKRKMV